jgi:hypothetical protein
MREGTPLQPRAAADSDDSPNTNQQPASSSTNHQSPTTNDLHPLTRLQRVFLWSLAVAFVLFIIPIEVRSAFLKRPMTDLQVYLRAAWAVRTGNDLYAIIDDNKWHYHYPALFAVLMVPLANAPAGEHQAWWHVRMHEAVVIWHFFSLLCLLASAHWLASALEEKSSWCAQPRYCFRWWALRVWPALVCITPIGQTLARGQVNLLVLALLCAMLAAALRGQSGRAGLWLAGAICVKIIPAFLLLYPLRQRDWRWLGGCAAGLCVGLALIPALVFGPQKAWSYTLEWSNVLLRPVLNRGGDHARDKELVEATATDSQSPLRIIHFALYPDLATRPADAAPWVRHTHWLIGGVLTVLTLWSMGRAPLTGPALVLGIGSLIICMLMLSPVSHQHYLCVMLPSVAGLLVWAWEQHGPAWLPRVLAVLLPFIGLAMFLPFIPGLGVLRDHGLPGFAAIVLLGVSCVVLRHARVRGIMSAINPEEPTRVAA